MLQATRISCHRDQRTLFENFSLSILPGELVQIEGANGAGKTSLLRILTGLSRPDSGEVSWQEQAIVKQRETWHRQLLYLAHQPGTKAILSAVENLHFYHPSASTDTIYHALEQVDLVGYEDIPVANLSAGQQRRVALARLWLTDALVWILDEPLTAIDKSGVKLLMDKFIQHTAQGGMIILTTHQNLPDYTSKVRQISLHSNEAEN